MGAYNLLGAYNHLSEARTVTCLSVLVLGQQEGA